VPATGLAGTVGDEAKVDAEIDGTPLEVEDEDALDGVVEAVLWIVASALAMFDEQKLIYRS